MLRTAVTPIPAYNPRTPCFCHIRTPVLQNVGAGGRGAPGATGRNSASVCIVDLMVSAGKNDTLYAAPAQAPATADSHATKSRSLPTRRAPVGKRRARSNEATYSLEVNQAAQPPASRMNVPR